MIRVDVVLPLGSFTLEAQCEIGEGVTSIVGASGSGKTSLVETIAGLRPAARGVVTIGDRALLDTARRIHLPPENRNLGYLSQDVALFPHIDVRANIQFAKRDAARFQEIVELLELGGLLDRAPLTLSGGEKQRVALARALMIRPAALLLDEPLASVDQPRRERVLTFLRRVRDHERIPILYVTHQPVEALALSRTCILLDRGRIAGQGQTDQLLRDPRTAGRGTIENVFEVDHPRHERERGITRVTTRHGVDLVLPFDLMENGEFPLAVRISGDEIVVFAEAPRSVSSRNVLRGRITSLRLDEGFGDLEIATPLPVRVRLTADAIADLGLTAGREVWLALRSRAFRVVG